jgi:hypothetical protein
MRCGVLLSIALGCRQASPPPTTSWPVPAGWREELIPFPLDFAPSLAHRGFEVIRFAPGFFDASAPGYWSYAFAWRLDDAAALDDKALAAELSTYFGGLVAAVDDKHKIADADRARIAAEAHATTASELAITVRLFDAFGDARPITIVGTAARVACGTGALWVFQIAPERSELRGQLVELAHAATCDGVRRPAQPAKPK